MEDSSGSLSGVFALMMMAGLKNGEQAVYRAACWCCRQADVGIELCSSRPHGQILAAVEAAPAVVAAVAVVVTVAAAVGSVEATAAHGALVSMGCAAGGKGSWPTAVRLTPNWWRSIGRECERHNDHSRGGKGFAVRGRGGIERVGRGVGEECLAVALAEVALQAEVAFMAAVEGVGLKRGEFLRTGEVITTADVVLTERKGLVRRSFISRRIGGCVTCMLKLTIATGKVGEGHCILSFLGFRREGSLLIGKVFL